MQLSLDVGPQLKRLYKLPDKRYIAHFDNGTFELVDRKTNTRFKQEVFMTAKTITKPTEVCDVVNGSVLIEPDGTVTRHKDLLDTLQQAAQKLKLMNFRTDYLQEVVAAS